MGCVLKLRLLEGDVVYGCEAAKRRARTRSGDVLWLRGWCSGERYVCKLR